MKKPKLIPAIGGGKEDPPELLWRVMLFNAVTMTEIENAFAYGRAHPDEEAAPTDNPVALLQQPSPGAFLGAGDWDESKINRVEGGRFGFKEDGEHEAANTAYDKANALAELSTRADFGDPDPPSPENGTMDWGTTTDIDEWISANDEARELVGPKVEGAVKDWSGGWGVDEWRDSYERYRETGSTEMSRFDREDAATTWGRSIADRMARHDEGRADFFEMLDNSVTDTPLFRGMTIQSDTTGKVTLDVSTLKVGDTMPDGLASWSRDPDVARVFRDANAAYFNTENPQVEMTLAPGAKGVDIAALGQQEFGWQEEVIVGGPLEITKIERSGEGLYGHPLYKIELKAAA